MVTYPIHLSRITFPQASSHRIDCLTSTPDRTVVAKKDQKGRNIRFEMYEHVTFVEREDEAGSGAYVRLHTIPNTSIEQSDNFPDDYSEDDSDAPGPVASKPSEPVKTSLAALQGKKS